MANTDYQGFGDETLNNALAIKNSINDIASSTQQLNRYLRASGNDIAGISSTYTDIAKSADRVASIQEKAAKNSKGMTAALEEQAKQTTIIRKLNLQIEDLYERAANASTPAITAQLKRQAENLANARDNAQELANSYGTIANDSAKLNKSTSFFSQLSTVASNIPVLNRFSAPFEKAAEAARKTTIENAKLKQTKDQIAKLSANELATGRGLTQAKLRSLGLEKVTGNLTGRDAAAALRNYQASAKAQSASGQAMRTAGAEALSMSNLLGKGGLVGLLVTIGKFILDILMGAQKQTVEIARNMGVTRDSAKQVQGYFNDIQNSSKETYINIDNLIKAQSELTEQMQRGGVAAESTLKAQSFLTERMKMSGEEAAVIAARSEQTGESAEKIVDSIMKQNAEDMKRGKSLTTQKQLLSQVAKVTGQIAASFGFSNKAIAEGVKKVNQYGLNLQQAAKISESLLNFEESLSSELSVELLTGKELTFEKARAMSITGDIAGATAEVMKQMKGLTAEQRKSPIIMDEVARATGISADEIQNAFLLEKDRTKQAEKLAEVMRSQGAVEADNYRKRMGWEATTMEEAKKTVTLQEQWEETLTKMKNQLMGLVGSGAIDILTDAIRKFSEWVAEYTGYNEEQATANAEKAVTNKMLSSDEAEKLNQQAKDLNPVERGLAQIVDYVGQYFGGGNLEENYDRKRDAARAKLKGAAEGKTFGTQGSGGSWGDDGVQTELPVNDYVIKPLKKDTITMAGGTKLGGNVESLLAEMLVEYRKGMNLYVGGQKINEIVGLNMYQIGNK